MNSKEPLPHDSCSPQQSSGADAKSLEPPRPVSHLPLNTKLPYELVRTIDTPLKNVSRYDIESGSETWVTNVRISNGRKMQRVWKSFQPDSSANSPDAATSVNISEQSLNAELETQKDDQVPQTEQKHQHEEPLKTLKYQSWFKLPDFTLKPKLSNEIEPSGDNEISLIDLSGSVTEITLSEIQSSGCLTKSKIEPRDLQYLNDNPSVYSAANGNSLIDFPNNEFDVQKSDRIRDWISPHTTASNDPIRELAVPPSEQILHSETDVTLKTDLKIEKSSKSDAQINEVSIAYTPSKSSLNQSEGFSRERPITPVFPNPLLHSATKIAKQFYLSRNPSKSQQQSQEPESLENSGIGAKFIPDEEMLASFRDISFHYEPKDGRLKSLIPTGFSVNFNYPAGSIPGCSKSSYSQGNVSTYFPGTSTKKTSVATIQVTGEDSVPQFIQDYAGKVDANNDKSNDDKDNNDNITVESQDPGSLDNSYKIQTLKPPSPCPNTSNTSLMPLIHSQATMGSLSLSQNALINGGFYSDNGMSVPSTVVGLGIRRRPRSVRNRPYSNSSDVLSIDRKSQQWNGGSNSKSNHFQEGFKNISEQLLIPSLSQNQTNHHESGHANKLDRLEVVGAGTQKVNGNPNHINIVGKSVVVSNDALQIKKHPVSKSDQYLVPRPVRFSYWDKPYGNRGISKVTCGTSTENQASKRISINKISTATSTSKGSIPTSSASSKNFIRENIEYIKGPGKGNLKMPTEERPPLPKVEGSLSQSKQAKASAPKKTVKSKVKALKPLPDTAQKIYDIIDATAEGTIGTSKDQKKSKITRKVRISEPVPKPVGNAVKKLASIEPDPYFMQASLSEQQIINEVVKADVDAILERDAGRNTAEIQPKVEPPRPKSRGTSSPVRPVGIHWAQSSPLNRNPFEDSMFQMVGPSTRRAGKAASSTLNSSKAKDPAVPIQEKGAPAAIGTGASGKKKKAAKNPKSKPTKK